MAAIRPQTAEEYQHWLINEYAPQRFFHLTKRDVWDLKLLLLADMRRRECWKQDWMRTQREEQRQLLLTKLSFLALHTPDIYDDPPDDWL
jgi:hypothetical protein